MPENHDVEHDTARPDIRGTAIVLLLLADLRRHKGWGTAPDVHFEGRLHCEPEVYDLGGAVGLAQVDKDVVRLQISVSDMALVDEVYALQDLLKDLGAYPFAEPLVGLGVEYLLQHLPIHVLHNQI